MIQVGEHIVQTGWFFITNSKKMFSCRFQLSIKACSHGICKGCLAEDVFNGWNHQMTKQWQIVCHHLTAMMVPPLLSLLWVFCFNRACMQPVGPNQPSHSTSNFILLSWALPKFFVCARRCLSSMPFKRAGAHKCWHDRSSVNPGCQQDKTRWTTEMGLLGGGFKYFLFSPLVGEDFHFD